MVQWINVRQFINLPLLYKNFEIINLEVLPGSQMKCRYANVEILKFAVCTSYNKVTVLLQLYECIYVSWSFRYKPVLRWLLELQKSLTPSLPGRSLLLSTTVLNDNLVTMEKRCRLQWNS